jgi:hypothetical protein
MENILQSYFCKDDPLKIIIETMKKGWNSEKKRKREAHAKAVYAWCSKSDCKEDLW